ncbi:MAG TPA: hypothetical protein VGB91_09215 [Rhizomicrobium sp.]
MGALIRLKAACAAAGKNLRMNLSDVWRTALELKKQFPGEAMSVAAARADQCFGRGDLDGSRSWSRVSQAIIEIERPSYPSGMHEAPHPVRAGEPGPPGAAA